MHIGKEYKNSDSTLKEVIYMRDLNDEIPREYLEFLGTGEVYSSVSWKMELGEN